MARFFFDTYDGEEIVTDADGVEFEELESVRDAAVNALPSIARDRFPNEETLEMWVRVRDAANRPVFEASLIFSSRWIGEAG